MIATITVLCLIGLGLLGYVKVNDKAEAYNLILPGIGGALFLFMAAVLAAIHWVF